MATIVVYVLMMFLPGGGVTTVDNIASKDACVEMEGNIIAQHGYMPIDCIPVTKVKP